MPAGPLLLPAGQTISWVRDEARSKASAQPACAAPGTLCYGPCSWLADVDTRHRDEVSTASSLVPRVSRAASNCTAPLVLQCLQSPCSGPTADAQDRLVSSRRSIKRVSCNTLWSGVQARAAPCACLWQSPLLRDSHKRPRKVHGPSSVHSPQCQFVANFESQHSLDAMAATSRSVFITGERPRQRASETACQPTSRLVRCCRCDWTCGRTHPGPLARRSLPSHSPGPQHCCSRIHCRQGSHTVCGRREPASQLGINCSAFCVSR